MNTTTDTITFSAVEELPARPLTVLIAALGGEGGGVLADWLVAAATAADYPVQSTSIPGVAQRTGATTYYVELYPAKRTALGSRRPVLALTPSPGNVDLMVASELVEAGRAMQAGFVSPDRTTLVASTHRIYTVAEKMQMGDGRADSDRIANAGRELAKRAVLFDMAELTARSGTVISAVMFGAIAGAGVLPLARADCQAAIRKAGKGVEGSLRGFALGYAHAAGEATPPSPAELKSWRTNPVERVRASFPAETHRILEEGVARVADYQDAAYATLYLDRLEPVAKIDRDAGGGASGCKLTAETGRFLALWMSYEDVIRVADLKSRRSRFERVRSEVLAKSGEPVHIIEYLKPGVEEVAAVLPGRLARALTGWAARRGLTDKLNVGLYVKTTSVSGFLMLRAMAWLRPLRRGTSRYRDEQALIERWLEAIRAAAARDLGLALEVALCGRLIKGYGETHRRAKANFLRILDTIVAGGSFADADRAAAIRQAREAALADPRAASSSSRSRQQGSRRCRHSRSRSSSSAGLRAESSARREEAAMEVSFREEIEGLKLGDGETFHGEGILAVTKALLQSGVAYVGGYQGAPVSHLLDVMVQSEDLLGELGIHLETCTNEAAAAAMLGASINYPLRGAVTWKSIVGTNVAADALSNLASPGVVGGALIIVGEDYGEGASVIQERTHAMALKSSLWLVDPRPDLPALVRAVEASFAHSCVSRLRQLSRQDERGGRVLGLAPVGARRLQIRTAQPSAYYLPAGGR